VASAESSGSRAHSPARRRLDSAVEAFDPARVETIRELREAVRERVQFKRDRSEPPEKALVATKDALLSALDLRSRPLEPTVVRAMIDDTTRWFVSTYYGDAANPKKAR
jgi:hypothetical protein